ncbi:MAG: enoyl-CoA hydratase/isomerase family protein [Hoeflea sp.]|uniref:enoyl-CoA hydratase/isomerase family protein n=1 Tax=Hoeflea sp. TaxID=1940281 RepID=UPI00273146DA|nr:enoyl-CoA hydratase/isomerase family protein [Hoeflea sp.]MDP2121676.1 enoyl-CoA hydratase/isomerase family protein [Hoeflea sp.]
MSGHIGFEIDGHIAVITIDRPEKLNAMTPEMAARLVELARRCNEDDAIRAVVLTGAGERAFSAGSDIRALDGYTTPWSFRQRQDYCDAVRRIVKPVVAAVNGYAFGGGLETSMSCDIRIASENASFAAPEVKLGWIGGGGMATYLRAAIGPSNAALMLMTGDPVDALTARQWGLVSEVVPQKDLLARAREIARIIATRAPVAVETAKLNLSAAAWMPTENAIGYERDLQTICFATEDAAEGRRAFAEKRTPDFRKK